MLRSSTVCDEFPCSIHKYPVECSLLAKYFSSTVVLYFDVGTPDLLAISTENTIHRDNDKWSKDWASVLFAARQTPHCLSLNLVGSMFNGTVHYLWFLKISEYFNFFPWCNISSCLYPMRSIKPRNCTWNRIMGPQLGWILKVIKTVLCKR